MTLVPFELFVGVMRDPDNEDQWRPIGIGRTEDDAYQMMTEAVDTIGLSMAIMPEGKRRVVAELLETIKVVPGSLLIDRKHLDG